jgi:hypothetical protein
VCSLEEDMDGDPRAYGPNENTMHERSLSFAASHPANFRWHQQNPDRPANERKFGWVGLIAKPQREAEGLGYHVDNRPFLEARLRADENDNWLPIPEGEPGDFPVIQKAPFAGFYVSSTSENTGLGGELDQIHYADASKIPYAAYASWWRSVNVNPGDFGLVIWPDTGAFTGFVFADAGGGRVGEVSTKVFDNLAPGQDKNVVNELRFLFLVFPGSGGGILRKDKFTSEAVVQEQMKLNIRKLNHIEIEDNEDVIDYLTQVVSRRPIPDDEAAEEADPVWWNIRHALLQCGFIPN